MKSPVANRARPAKAKDPTIKGLFMLTSVLRNELARRFVFTALYLAHFPESNQIALVEYGETVPDSACAVDVMRHDEDCGSTLGFLSQQQFVNLGCRDPVEATARLIGQENFRLENERPR